MTFNFKSGKEMLETIQSDIDLYSPTMNIYVFLYNDSGSICCYDVDNDKAKELENRSRQEDEYWGAFLGWGGCIYDDPGYKYYKPEFSSNLDFCKATFNQKWIRTTDVLNEE